MRRRCPVCRVTVYPTMGRNIIGHLDGSGQRCPMSGLAYDLAEITTIKKRERIK